MGEELKQFMAALHYAAWNRQNIRIAGSDFTHAEVVRIVENLEALIPSGVAT